MKYRLEVEVTRARGSQTYIIEAGSELEARQKFDQGDGDCIHEEFEADNFGAIVVRAES